MNGLLLHTGGLSVSIEDVLKVVTPQPTATHMPIPHHELIEISKDVLTDRGWSIVQEAHALSRNGMNYFGLMELDRPNLIPVSESSHPASPQRVLSESSASPHGMTRTLVGLRNSHSFQYSAAMALGSRVFVCDNLVFTGEIVLGRKHTKNILRDLPPLVSLAVAKINHSQEVEKARFAAYQSTQIDRKTADHLLLSGVRAAALMPSSLGKVLEDVDHPERRHPEFAEFAGTVFGLYMAVTEHNNGSLPQAPKRCMRLHSILDPIALFQPERQIGLADVGVEQDEIEWLEAA